MIALLPLKHEVETKLVLRKTALAHGALAELKGVVGSIPINLKVYIHSMMEMAVLAEL